jgi:hypothetical protein
MYYEFWNRRDQTHELFNQRIEKLKEREQKEKERKEKARQRKSQGPSYVEP